MFKILIYLLIVLSQCQDGEENIQWEQVEIPKPEGEPTSNYGEISREEQRLNGIFRTLRNKDYDIVAKPEIKQQAIDFAKMHYKSICETEKEIIEYPYVGSSTLPEELLFQIEAHTDREKYIFSISFKDFNSETQEFHKIFIGCDRIVRQFEDL
ncbi:hypothetical protein pb186bvf_008043 [Paramecium bursaria]